MVIFETIVCSASVNRPVRTCMLGGVGLEFRYPGYPIGRHLFSPCVCVDDSNSNSRESIERPGHPDENLERT